MYNTSNPAELYSGTTWELLASDKYLKTTTGTPLSSGGSNSFTIQKANLPAVKIQIDSHSHTQPAHKHRIPASTGYSNSPGGWSNHDVTRVDNEHNVFSIEAGGENTSSSAPYTQNLGSGTAISISPTYITIRAWKRLT